MTNNPTGAMQQFGAPTGPSAGGPLGGLVLLYADNFAELPAAWTLDRDRMVLGRDDTADIRLPVSSVSRIHAELAFENGGWVLRDRGSRNGTLVEGRRITAIELEPNMDVRIGDAVFKFVELGAEYYAQYRLDGTMAPGAARRGKSAEALVGGYQIDRIAADVAQIANAPISVLLLGESGTGKEVVAQELHRLSGRRGQFCAVNCAAIPASLIESELFGYKRGAFSGAERDKPGLIRTAHEGTLLLDEIGDMPLEAQAKLLRVLQSREVFPVGATAPERVDVRVVCATHRDLALLQKAGGFRQDLFGRLSEYTIRLPPLRERKEDLYLLTRAFLARHGRPELAIPFPVMLALLHYDWPYNVRELEACIKRCVVVAAGRVLTDQDLPQPVIAAMEDYGETAASPASVPSVLPQAATIEPVALAQVPSEPDLRALLQAHAGNVAAVGRQLGKARMQVHRWMKRYGIDVDDYRR